MKTQQNEQELDAVIYKLRNSNPKIWTWSRLDREILDVDNAHGGRSFEAYARQRALESARKSLDSVVFTLRNINPEKWTFDVLDREILGVTNAHGNRSFLACARERAARGL